MEGERVNRARTGSNDANVAEASGATIWQAAQLAASIPIPSDPAGSNTSSPASTLSSMSEESIKSVDVNLDGFFHIVSNGDSTVYQALLQMIPSCDDLDALARKYDPNQSNVMVQRALSNQGLGFSGQSRLEDILNYVQLGGVFHEGLDYSQINNFLTNAVINKPAASSGPPQRPLPLRPPPQPVSSPANNSNSPPPLTESSNRKELNDEDEAGRIIGGDEWKYIDGALTETKVVINQTAHEYGDEVKGLCRDELGRKFCTGLNLHGQTRLTKKKSSNSTGDPELYFTMRCKAKSNTRYDIDCPFTVMIESPVQDPGMCSPVILELINCDCEKMFKAMCIISPNCTIVAAYSHLFLRE